MKILILSILISITLFSVSYAASNKEVYELQERCGKSAKEEFKHEAGNGIYEDDKQVTISYYTSHYNRRLNKCFVLSMTTSRDKPKNKKGDLTFKELRDINENKTYATFSKFVEENSPVACRVLVLDKICKSENEWDSLVKPYMEE